MNIGRALLEGVAEQMIERLYDRRRRGIELLILRRQIFLVAEAERRQPLRRELLLGGLQTRTELVEALDDRVDIALRRDDALDGAEAGDALDVVDGEVGERIVNGDRELLVGLGDRDESVAPRERTGECAGDDVEIQFERIELDVSQVRKAGDG